MEKVILLEKIDREKIKPFDRVYFGNEFCQNLIPSLEEFKEQTSQIDKPFSFVTPYVTDKGLKKLDKILNYLNEKGCEIIVNDFGLLNHIQKNYSNLKIILGRLLTHNLFSLTKDIKLNSELSTEFFKNIERVELSTRGPNTILPSTQFELSLYYPCLPISTTRRCNIGLKQNFNSFSCSLECKNKIKEIKNPIIKNKLIQKGNTYFIKFKELPNLENVSRLIFQELTSF